MSKKKNTGTGNGFPKYKRTDHDRIWIEDDDNGPKLMKRKGNFTDVDYLTENDLKLIMRIIGRRLARDFTIIPIADTPPLIRDPFGLTMPKMIEAGRPEAAADASTG